MYHTVCMLMKEASILKCIVPPTVPSGLIQEKGYKYNNTKRVDGHVNYFIMKQKLTLVSTWVC